MAECLDTVSVPEYRRYTKNVSQSDEELYCDLDKNIVNKKYIALYHMSQLVVVTAVVLGAGFLSEGRPEAL